MKESYVSIALEMLKSWFDFRLLYLGCEWEVYFICIHICLYTHYTYTHMSTYRGYLYIFIYVCMYMCVYTCLSNNVEQ